MPKRTGVIDLETIDLLCFDMDGTLLDLNFRDPEMRGVRDDLHDMFAEYGIEKEFTPLLETLDQALAELARDESEQIVKWMETAAYQRITREDVHAANHQSVRWEAKLLLDELAQREVPFAIVTNNSRRGAKIALEDSGLHCPKVLVSRDDVEDSKPAPDMVTEAIERSALHVDQLVVVGDRQSDVDAGVAAGNTEECDVMTVLIGNSTDECNSEANFHVESLRELRQDVLL